MKRRLCYGAGPPYTDLEKLRIEYWVRETDMTTREMAEKLGTRSKVSVSQHLWRRGISLLEERGKREDSWAGV